MTKIIVFQDKLGQATIFINFNYLWFLWKTTYFRLGTISENVCIGGLLWVCQISCLYQKVHNSPELWSKAAGLKTH